LAISKAMGATIKTVATFSTKLEIKPARIHTDNNAIPTVFEWSTNFVARYAGTAENIKRPDKTIVPRNTPRTLKFMLEIACVRLSTRLNKSKPMALPKMIKGWPFFSTSNI
jgi:hypothetical protein